MDIFAFGNGLDTAIGVGPSVLEATNFYVSFPIAGETPGCVMVNQPSSIIITLRDPASNVPTSITEGWVHFRHIPGYNGGSGTEGIFYLKNSSGVKVMRVWITGNGDAFTYRIEYWNGSTWLASGITGIWGNRGVAAAYDVYFKIHGSLGQISAYSDGTTVGNVTGLDTSGMGNVATVELRNCNDGHWGYWGWIVAQGGSTIGHLCRCRLVTGAGANTAWTGTYADVDEYPVSDADYIETASAGDKESFAATAFGALPAGNLVKAVGIGARVRNNGGTPATIRGNLTIGGVDYPTVDCDGVIAGWGPARMLYPIDPSTSTPWTSNLTNVNVEFGVESRT